MPTNLRELIPVCGDRVNRSVPIWDATECRWTTTVLSSSGSSIDCATDIMPCVQPSLDAINIQLTNVSNSVNNLNTTMASVSGTSHTHANKSLLDTITSSGSPLRYLGEDGIYHSLPYAVSPFYQTIATIGGGVHNQRQTSAFGPEFIITDDPAGNRTLINIDPAYLGGGSGGGLDCTAVMSCPGIIGMNSSLTNLTGRVSILENDAASYLTCATLGSCAVFQTLEGRVTNLESNMQTAISALNGGVEITPMISSINFAGTGVTATSDVSGNVTVTVVGGGTFNCEDVITCVESAPTLNLHDVTVDNLSFAPGAIVNRDNSTQTGTTVFDDNYNATYNDGSVVNNNGVVNNGATHVTNNQAGSVENNLAGSTTNNNGATNYGATSIETYTAGAKVTGSVTQQDLVVDNKNVDTINDANSSVTNNGNTIANNGTTTNNSAGAIENYDSTTVQNVDGTTNYADTSVINNDGGTVNNTGTTTTNTNATTNNVGGVTNNTAGVTENYDSTTIQNVDGTTNYTTNATTNHTSDTINQSGTTINNTGGTTENNDSTTVQNNSGTTNNTNATINNSNTTTNYDATSTINNNGNTINNTGTTVNYDNTSTVNLPANTTIGGTTPGYGFKTLTGTMNGTTVVINDVDVLVGSPHNVYFGATPIGNITSVATAGTITLTSTGTEVNLPYTVVLFASQTQNFTQPVWNAGNTLFVSSPQNVLIGDTVTINHSLGATQSDVENGKYSVMYTYNHSSLKGIVMIDTDPTASYYQQHIRSTSLTPSAFAWSSSSFMFSVSGPLFGGTSVSNLRVIIKQNR